jgi:hypothetical protein
VPSRPSDRTVEICAEPEKKKVDRAGDGNNVTGRGVASGGQARTSPETGTMWMAAASPM